MNAPLSGAPTLATPATEGATARRSRLQSIDALRGLVMLFMLIDHVRETFYLHRQVSDPVDVTSVEPALFFTRLLSTLCAPVFILLTGLSAWLYSQSHTRRETSAFLFKRGLFLIALELTLVSFAWNGEVIPRTLWLQVIWCIGICMLVLSALLYVPRLALLALGVAIVGGHNLLDGWVLDATSSWYIPWSILHQKVFFDITDYTRARTTYPVLPWIGVIALGWVLGPWFAQGKDSAARVRKLFGLGAMLLLAFVGLRYWNGYGELPWTDHGDPLMNLMGFLSARKYPPSLMFLLPTLGLGLMLLAALERWSSRMITLLALFGAAPMFFYLLHLYVLKGLYLVALEVWGANHGEYFGFDGVSGIWLTSLVLAWLLFYPTRGFAGLKQRRRDWPWLKYF